MAFKGMKSSLFSWLLRFALCSMDILFKGRAAFAAAAKSFPSTPAGMDGARARRRLLGKSATASSKKKSAEKTPKRKLAFESPAADALTVADALTKKFKSQDELEDREDLAETQPDANDFKDEFVDSQTDVEPADKEEKAEEVDDKFQMSQSDAEDPLKENSMMVASDCDPKEPDSGSCSAVQGEQSQGELSPELPISKAAAKSSMRQESMARLDTHIAKNDAKVFKAETKLAKAQATLAAHAAKARAKAKAKALAKAPLLHQILAVSVEAARDREAAAAKATVAVPPAAKAKGKAKAPAAKAEGKAKAVRPAAKAEGKAKAPAAKAAGKAKATPAKAKGRAKAQAE